MKSRLDLMLVAEPASNSSNSLDTRVSFWNIISSQFDIGMHDTMTFSYTVKAG